MRFPRFVLLVLGFLLIGLIGVSVSYLHHLMYPDTLSENDLARGQIPRVELRLETKRMGNTALNPLDRPIDELAAHCGYYPMTYCHRARGSFMCAFPSRRQMK
jgi:hypothetical protein